MTNNLLLDVDSYKVSHYRQYPPGTQTVHSYFESRGGDFPMTMFFGLQYIIKRYLAGPVVDNDKITEAKELYRQHFGNDTFFNEDGWKKIVQKHGGHLPIQIKAVPEGTVLHPHNVLVTVENTDPDFYWLTNYIETMLVRLWYPCTVATQSRVLKQYLLDAFKSTSDAEDPLTDVLFKLHDFGCRGVTCTEQAAIGGLAHLVNFLGSDTVPALQLGREYYREPCAGFSISAAEHSTITSWGQSRELDAYRNMLEQYPTGLVAVVSDSYDIFNACRTLWGEALKDEVINRDGVTIIRPDSGNPVEVLPKVLTILGEKFGTTTNSKGFKVLHPKVRVIQGDGIDLFMLPRILTALQSHGWAIDNIAFGSGGGLLQKMNRDTSRYAFKCSSITIDGAESDVSKNPTTDPTKTSKRGRFKLIHHKGVMDSYFTTVSDQDSRPDCLRTVFYNGNLLIDETLATIRGRANEFINQF